MKTSTFTKSSLFLIVLILPVYLFHLGGDQFLQIIGGIYPIFFSCVASIMLFNAFTSFQSWDGAKITWLLLCIGTSSFAIAETIYFILETIIGINKEELSPSAADLFWCIAYLFYLTGMFAMIIRYMKSGLPLHQCKRHLIPTSVLLLALSVAIYWGILKDINADIHLSSLEKFIYFYYPITDLLILFPAIILIYITKLLGEGSVSVPWRMLALGFVIMCIADLIYTYLDSRNLYHTGNMVDILWNISYIFIGLSGLYQQTLMASIAGNEK